MQATLRLLFIKNTFLKHIKNCHITWEFLQQPTALCKYESIFQIILDHRFTLISENIQGHFISFLEISVPWNGLVVASDLQ